MLSRFSRLLTVSLFAAVLFAAISLSPQAAAQQSPKPAPTATPARESGTDPALATAEIKQEDHQENKGEQDWFRKSPSVLWLARKTGMSNDAAYWVAVVLNFAIVFFLIALFMRKSLPGFFQGRTSAIQKGIEEARKMSEEARRRLTEVESRLSRLDTEIAAMRSEAEENGRAEERRIQESGEEERKRIVASAQQEIDMAAGAARRELKSYAAALAIDLAEKKIRVDQNKDEALVREFTAQLGKDGN
jgi:F-type H+-transporting ATPase subunit b